MENLTDRRMPSLFCQSEFNSSLLLNSTLVVEKQLPHQLENADGKPFAELFGQSERGLPQHFSPIQQSLQEPFLLIAARTSYKLFFELKQPDHLPVKIGLIQPILYDPILLKLTLGMRFGDLSSYFAGVV